MYVIQMGLSFIKKKTLCCWCIFVGARVVLFSCVRMSLDILVDTAARLSQPAKRKCDLTILDNTIAAMETENKKVLEWIEQDDDATGAFVAPESKVEHLKKVVQMSQTHIKQLRQWSNQQAQSTQGEKKLCVENNKDLAQLQSEIATAQQDYDAEVNKLTNAHIYHKDLAKKLADMEETIQMGPMRRFLDPNNNMYTPPTISLTEANNKTRMLTSGLLKQFEIVYGVLFGLKAIDPETSKFNPNLPPADHLHQIASLLSQIKPCFDGATVASMENAKLQTLLTSHNIVCKLGQHGLDALDAHLTARFVCEIFFWTDVGWLGQRCLRLNWM